jgi:hypothetical protein
MFFGAFFPNSEKIPGMAVMTPAVSDRKIALITGIEYRHCEEVEADEAIS